MQRQTALTVALYFCCWVFAGAQQNIAPTEAALRSAIGGGGRITFTGGGTIVLAETLVIDVDTIIDARSREIVLSGGGDVRVFQVTPGVRFELVNITIQNGRGTSGGGIFNDGGLVTVRGCVFVDNVARGDDGAAGVNGTGNNIQGGQGAPGVAGGMGMGGGIFSSGSLWVFDSTFRENIASGGQGGSGGSGADGLNIGGNGGDGAPGGGARGGALATSGTLVLSNSVFLNNTARGGDGGAGGKGGTYGDTYYLTGTTAVGGDGGDGASAGEAGGGAVYATGGVEIRATKFSGNSADAGAGGHGGPGGGSGVAQGGNGGIGGPGGISLGGGVHLEEAAGLFERCQFSDSTANGGSGGDGATSGVDLLMGQQGAGARGGDANGSAVFVSGGNVSFRECSLRKNSGAGGSGGLGADAFAFSGGRFLPTPGASGGPGGSALGTIFNLGSMTITETAIAGNVLRGGDGARGGNGGSARTVNGSNGGSGGSAGNAMGAGIYTRSSLIAVNMTLASNLARGGNGGVGGRGGEARFAAETTRGGTGGNGGDAPGAGLAIDGGFASLQSVTMATNTVEPGEGAPGGPGDPQLAENSGGTGRDGIRGGDNFFVGAAATLSLGNTIIAANGLNRAGSGTLVDEGANICSDTSCGFTQSTLNNTDPLLIGLADNGGLTPTMALRPGSPAIDAADMRTSPSIDQRGFLRPAGAGSDIGAFEREGVQPPQGGTLGVRITGRVTDGTNGIPGVRVQLGKWSDITDEDGAYEFVVPDKRRYAVRPAATAYRFKPAFRLVRVRGDVEVRDFVAKPRRVRRQPGSNKKTSPVTIRAPKVGIGPRPAS